MKPATVANPARTLIAAAALALAGCATPGEYASVRKDPLKDGSIVRDIDGRPMGVRYLDLRSRGTNPRSSGLLLLY